MSEPLPRRTVFFELRGMFGLVLFAILSTHSTLASSELWLLGIAFLLSNLALLFVPSSKFNDAATGYVVFFVDMAVLTVFFCALSGLQSESLPLYYLTVFMATLGADVRKSVGITVVVAALFAALKLSHGPGALWNSVALLHVPLFFVTAIFTGYVAQELLSQKRRISGLSEIHKSLESDLEVSIEELARSESGRAAAQGLAQRFHDLIQNLDAIIWEADAASLLFVFVSQRAEEILGYPSEHWVTVPDFWIDHIHAEDRARTLAAFRKMLLAGKDHELEYRMIASDGRAVWFRNIVRVIRASDGRALRIRGVMLDITKEKLAEERDLLFKLSLDLMCIAGFDGYFKRLNPAWETTLGLSREELLASPYIEFVHSDDREATLAEAAKLAAGHATVSFQNRYRSKDGGYKWLVWTAAPVPERQLIYAVARDDTERKQAENEIKTLNDELEERVANRTVQLENAYHVLEKEVAERKQAVEDLMESESRYRLLFECNPEPMWAYDLETLAFLAVNNAAVRQYGYTREEFLSMTIKDIRPAEDVPALLQFIEKIPNGISAPHLWRHRRKDGTVFAAEITSHPLTFARRRAELVLATDVTERKRADEALRASEERFRLFVRHAPAAIAMLDCDMRYVATSRRWLTDYGLKDRNVVGMSHFDVFPGVPAKWKEIQQRCLAGAVEKCEDDSFPGVNGAPEWVRWEARPWRDHAGQVGGILLFSEVITERKKLEERLRQAEKMEAVGQLAGGIAHDFNNLLTIISGYGQLLLEHGGANDALTRTHAGEILKAADRAASLTRQLLAFSRRQVLAPQALDLNGVVGNVQKMLRRLIGEHIDLATCLASDLGRVKADPGQIEQVIINLAVNSRDAMPDGGKLTLETANVELDEAYVLTHVPATPGLYVMLAVCDTGVGMDRETQAHMFEPFFTTKGPGKGTGLGLATVYGIVKQSNGYIWVYSELGRGTTIKIYLPRVQEEVIESESRQISPAASRAGETILVVEDESAVRSLVRGILSSKGYQVLEASRGEEALSVCSGHQGPLHLVITDVIMPQMSGRELATRLASLHPGVKVLFMSGYTNEGIIRQGVLERNTAFLPKPFTPDSLVRRVREVLDSHSSTPVTTA